MALTISELAKLSGVSSKTLRHYDAIGLLSPSYIGDNQYRYYEKKELLQLQQILFYRELGFALKDIKAVLTASDFDQAQALRAHRKHLQGEGKRIKTLVNTIYSKYSNLRVLRFDKFPIFGILFS